MKKVQVNSGSKAYEFELWLDNGHICVRRNGQAHRADLVRRGCRYSLIIDGRSFEVGVNSNRDCYTIYSGSQSGRFCVENYELAQVKARAGIVDDAEQKSLTAPMPGLIIRVNCEAGEAVEKNQPLFVMEAMKMENDIKSPMAGTLKTVSVSVGESVDKGQVLAEFE